jgi:hypothetical protein
LVLFTYDGQICFNNTNFDDGTLIIPKTHINTDGITIYIFKDHIIPIYLLRNRLQSKALIDTYISYNITLTCENKADPGLPLKVKIPISKEFKYQNSISHEGNYNSETEIWTLTLKNNTATLNFILQPQTTGTVTQTVTFEKDGTTLTNSCEIVENDPEDIYYNEEPLKNYPTNIANLQDGKLYTVVKYAYLNITDESMIEGVHNNRLTVINGMETIGEHIIHQRNWEKITTTFIYTKDHPITIREYGTGNHPHIPIEELWAGLCINEGFNTQYRESFPLLSNPTAFMNDTGYTELELPGQNTSTPYTYTTPPITIPSKEHPIVTGLKLILNNFHTNQSGITVQLCNDIGICSAVKTRPLQFIGQIQLGDMADTWQLPNQEIKDHTLRIQLKFNNNTLQNRIFTYNNLKLITYWEDDQNIGLTGFTVNNIHSRIYQIYFDHDNNQNIELNFKTLEFPQTDGTIPVGQNITPRELEIQFKILGNTLEETETKYRHITNWLQNKRTQANTPIPNTLIFDYNPQLEYQVVLKKLEAEKNISTYHCKASFLIPDGVGHTIEPVITGPIGMNMGKTPANPLITVKSKGEDKIILKDQITDYTLTLNQKTDENMVLYFNCENRTVTNTQGDNYTSHITIDSVWFKFYTEYDLTCSGALIESIQYHETY